MTDPAKALTTKLNRALTKRYPKAKCSLDYKNPLQLLVATILSAQCTDARVNVVTKQLFIKYFNAQDYADAPIEQIEEHVHSTGFYRNKAKAVKNACIDIVARFDGEVPDTMESLITLAGVGRKTANVILGNAYNRPEGVVVDTHVGRITQRWGITSQKKPEKIEIELMRLLAKKEWTNFAHRVILFGRETCQAKKPKCAHCPVESLCGWHDKRYE